MLEHFRRKITIAAVSALAALVAVALMAPTGGFPSRPRFQSVGIGLTNTATGTLQVRGTPGTTGQIRISDVQAAPNNTAYISFGDNTGTRTGYVGDDSSGTTFAIANEQVNGNLLVSTNGTGQVVVTNEILTVSGLNPSLRINDTDAAADNRLFLWHNTGEQLLGRACNDSVGTCNQFMTVDRTGATVDSVNISGTDVQTNGVSIAASSGTFTASFDTACTTTPTLTFDYQRIGNIVVLYSVSQTGFTCTGDAITFETTGAPMPAAIRPAGTVHGDIDFGFTDNSAATGAVIQISSAGNVSFLDCNAGATTCTANGWTAALNRGIALNKVITYMLGNP